MSMDKLFDNKRYQEETQALWEQHKVYNFAGRAGRKVFSIDTPPPTVSGTLHIGHVFSYTQTDLVARYKRMTGYEVFYPMGFDDNGLATERYVEKVHSVRGHHMPRSEFIALCLRQTHEAEKGFEALWRALGLSIDWTTVYSTIAPNVQRVSQHSFVELYKKNLVYRKQDPALYCTTCRTSVAQAELENIEKASVFNDLIFTTEDGRELIVATTRPELIPGCVALFFHPEDERYKELAGTFVTTPVFEQRLPIIADDKVDPAKGSGLVMCCTFGDTTDIYWYKKHSLPYIEVVGRDGKWTAKGGPLAGMNATEARKRVLELLAEQGKLVNQKQISHNVNVHERCKQEIEYVILSQWFVNILDHKEEFIKIADKISWNPEFMKARYIDWVSNLSWDWCISRQRFFGIPFPVWHCGGCQKTLLAKPEQLPIDPQEKPYPGGACDSCGSSDIRPETDVMDTWNTSALTPEILAGWPDAPTDLRPTLPLSMRPQAHDIIRTWAFDTIVKSYYHHHDIPWQDIVISGHVMAAKGEKISKSKDNNKMAPETLLQTYPADVIRYWTASGKLGYDTAFSETQFKIGQRLVTKLWNAFRFAEPQLSQYQPSGKQEPADVLSQWVCHELSKTLEAYHKRFNAYEYDAALEQAERFFWSVWCDNYLELSKDLFMNPDRYSNEQLQDARWLLYHGGFALLQMFAPFMPYVTETLYQRFFVGHQGVASLHRTQFDTKRYTHNYQTSTKLMEQALMVVTAVRKLKTEAQLSLKQPLASLTVCCATPQEAQALQALEALIAGVCGAQACTFAVGKGQDSMVQDDALWQATVYLVE